MEYFVEQLTSPPRVRLTLKLTDRETGITLSVDYSGEDAEDLGKRLVLAARTLIKPSTAPIAPRRRRAGTNF